MKAEESRALIRWYILGAVGGLMAAGDWLLGCVPLQATDTGMFNHRRPLSKGQNGPVFVRHLYRGSGAGLPPGGLEYPAGGHPRPCAGPAGARCHLDGRDEPEQHQQLHRALVPGDRRLYAQTPADGMIAAGHTAGAPSSS